MSVRLAITIGDPAGIGPEVVLKALAHRDPRMRDVTPILIGNLDLLDSLAKACGLELAFTSAAEPIEVAGDALPVVDVPNTAHEVSVGEVSAQGGTAAWKYLEAAVDLCKRGAADGLVTAPINKQALALAGYGHEGHTEILQRMTKSAWSLTLFVTGSLRVLFYSRHLSLKDAIDAVRSDRLLDVLLHFSEAASSIGLSQPRIAVAGLNPHCGDGGLFGTEEISEIEPGIRRARREGIDVVGPIPADAVFHLAREGRYDVVLSLYHDQAAAVTKSIDFHGTVSVTLGLPFLRFSVDHGTAFDIAGTNSADHRNMLNTLGLAAKWTALRLTTQI